MRPFRLGGRSFSPTSALSKSRHPFPPQRRPITLLKHAARRRYQTAAGSQAEPQIHVHRPFFTPRRALYILFTGSVVYYGTGWFFSRLGAVDLEAAEVELEEDEETGEHEGSIFIPFQWPQMAPRSFYKESDSDWQEFARIARDGERLSAIRAELANRCVDDISKAPKLRQVLGNNIELGQAWLDIKYPDRPPPEYHRSGVEIADDYIAWGTQTIPHSHYVQLRHMMYPKSIFSAAYNSITIFSQLQWIKIKNAIGMDMTQKDKQLSMVSKIEKGRLQLEAIEDQHASNQEAADAAKQRLLEELKNSSAGGDSLKPSAVKPPGIPQPAQTDPPSTGTSHPLLAMLFSTSSDASSDSSPVGSIHPALTYLRPGADMTLAWKTFLATLQMTWARSRLDTQPKGAFFIVGQVEVRGERGRIKCDVQAAYDPKISKIVFCICQVKHYWEWQQRAKGGK